MPLQIKKEIRALLQPGSLSSEISFLAGRPLLNVVREVATYFHPNIKDMFSICHLYHYPLTTLLLIPINPIKPLPRSQKAAGIGTAANSVSKLVNPAPE